MTISNRLWKLIRMSRRIGVRISLIALLAVFAAVIATVIDGFIPQDWVDRFGVKSVLPILDILTDSMLVVVTFSLSVMVATHRAAANQTTPRSHRLLLEDTTTQTVVATFLGAFIYALVAHIFFDAGFYSERAAVIVFGFTLVVVALVILAILRWIEHLSHLGSMDETLDRVEAAVRRSLDYHRRAPHLYGQPLDARAENIPPGLVPVLATSTGYIQNVDMNALETCAGDKDLTFYLTCIPGDWVSQGNTIAFSTRATDDLNATLADALVIRDDRTYDQDARFGLSVLAEIASRALSPGINDPGTALDVLGRLERLLIESAPSLIEAEPVAYEHVHVPALPEAELIEDAFATVARDGAHMIEVASGLQKTLRQLARGRDAEMSVAAREMSELALAHAETALKLDQEKTRLRVIAGKEGDPPYSPAKPRPVTHPRRT